MKRIEIIGEDYTGRWDRQRISCRGIVVQDDRILLSYETLTDTWMLPGGGLEDGEDAAACCIREVGEETGFVIEVSSCVLEIDEYYKENRYLSKYFYGTIKGSCKISQTDKELEVRMEPRWLPVDEAIDIFSTYASYTDIDEMKAGLYLREYTALCELFQNPQEKKRPDDMIRDGILAYGVTVGRFLFEKERKTVYAISDFPHIGASDVFMCYQISKTDYERLISMSRSDRIPAPEVSAEVTDACKRDFLCGESAYCKRNSFTLDDVDLSLTESF